MVRYVAVIDLGKSNSKLALVDTQTTQELHVRTQHATVNNAGLYPSIDHLAIETFLVDEVWKAMRTVSDRCHYCDHSWRNCGTYWEGRSIDTARTGL